MHWIKFNLFSSKELSGWGKRPTLGTLGDGFRFHENLLLTFDELHTWILHFATAFLLKSLRDSKMISQLIQILRVPYTTVKMSKHKNILKTFQATRRPKIMFKFMAKLPSSMIRIVFDCLAIWVSTEKTSPSELCSFRLGIAVIVGLAWLSKKHRN